MFEISGSLLYDVIELACLVRNILDILVVLLFFCNSMDQAHLYGRIWSAQGTNQNAGFCSGPAQPHDKTLYCPANAGLSKINLCIGMDGLMSTIYNLLFCKLSLSASFFIVLSLLNSVLS